MCLEAIFVVNNRLQKILLFLQYGMLVALRDTLDSNAFDNLNLIWPTTLYIEMLFDFYQPLLLIYDKLEPVFKIK